MLAWIGAKLIGAKLWLYEALAACAVAFGLYEAGHYKGSKAGANTVEVQTAHATAEAVTEAKQVQTDVAKLPPGAAEAELEKEWTRGKQP